jgi:nuclear pore complex protein Nup62
MEPPVLAYQTLTVEEILNKFQRQIEEDSLAFIEEAKRVCDYDAVLRDSQRDLANLTTEAQRLMIEQDQIENGLNTIGAFQNQLDTILTGVEDQVGSIFQAQNHLNPVDADIERERAYETAKMIEYQLDDVTNSLRDTFDTLNQASASAFGAGGNSTDTSGGDINGINSAYDVITILNRHQDGLAQLEATAQKLELDCNEVTAVLQTSRR